MSLLDKQDVPPGKSIMFDVGSKDGAITGGELSRKFGTDASEGVPESLSLVVGSLFWRVLLGGKVMRYLRALGEVKKETAWCGFQQQTICWGRRM